MEDKMKKKAEELAIYAQEIVGVPSIQYHEMVRLFMEMGEYVKQKECEPVGKNFDEEFKRYIKGTGFYGEEKENLFHCARHFTNWQKQQEENI